MTDKQKRAFTYACVRTDHRFVFTTQENTVNVQHIGPKGGERDSFDLPIETLREILHWAWREETRQTAKG